MNIQNLSQVVKALALSLGVYLIARFFMIFIPSWGSVWDGVLYFSFLEVAVFFSISFFALVLVNRRWPKAESEKIYLRGVLCITTTVVIGSVISLLGRDFAQTMLIAYAFCMVAWALFGKLLKAALVFALLIAMLLITPMEIKFSTRADGTHEHGLFVDLLEANYGLVDQPRAGTYPMGCVVPIYPVKWILQLRLQ